MTLRVAIVGCGKIADQHVQALRRVPGSVVVAACDREILMARQLAERFGIQHCFNDVGEMLRQCGPNVVHITTPPQSHYAIGRQCLEAGAHVYVEKPFTVTADEASSPIDLAQRLQLSVTAGHNYQFTPEMMAMRRLVQAGFLGGSPLHLESHWSYDLGDTSYVSPLLGSRNHWLRRLPGQLFHNLVSHGVARLAEFMNSEIEEISVSMHQSERMRSLGGQEVQDELRATVRDVNGVTATFVFSTQIKPGFNMFRIYGPAASITVDLTSGTLLRHPGRSYKSYLTFVLPQLVSARDELANAGRNAWEILRGRLYQDAGMKELIERFHRCVAGREPPPIPYREIELTALIMDRLFASRREPLRSTAPLTDANV